MDAASGRIVFRGRIGAPGPYYAAPVAADGKVFVASGDGIITVLRAGDELKILAQTELGDPIFATPAPVGGALYVRSANSMWAFGTR